jgi:mannose-6-phosphate isomerase
VESSYDPATFSTVPYSRRVEKPWGYEILLTAPDKPYAGKLLVVRAGQRLSLQIHDVKQETIVLVSGRARLQADNERGELETIEMLPGCGYAVVPGQRHRLIAVEYCEFFEASTPESGTTLRLEDDHGRGHETEDHRRLTNRGWERPSGST